MYSALVGTVTAVLEAFEVLLVDDLVELEAAILLPVELMVCEVVLDAADVFTDIELFEFSSVYTQS